MQLPVRRLCLVSPRASDPGSWPVGRSRLRERPPCRGWRRYRCQRAPAELDNAQFVYLICRWIALAQSSRQFTGERFLLARDHCILHPLPPRGMSQCAQVCVVVPSGGAAGPRWPGERVRAPVSATLSAAGPLRQANSVPCDTHLHTVLQRPLAPSGPRRLLPDNVLV
jgi:hypothetical protein